MSIVRKKEREREIERKSESDVESENTKMCDSEKVIECKRDRT